MKTTYFLPITALAFFLMTSSSVATQNPKCLKNKTEKVNEVDIDFHFIQEAINNVMEQLKIQGDLEVSLFVYATKGKIRTEITSNTRSIILMRPTEKSPSLATFEFQNQEQNFILQMTKMSSPTVTEPLAIITDSYTEKGMLIHQTQQVLKLNNKKQWVEISKVK